MLALFINPTHRSALLLVVATIAAFWMRNDGAAGLGIGIGTLLVAYLKGRLIVLDFMELRHAPWPWRALVEGWLLIVSALIILLYYHGAGTRG